MIGPTTSSSITSVYALNGKLFVGTTVGLYVVDFKNDTSWRYTSSSNSPNSTYIGARNSAAAYAAYTTTTTARDIAFTLAGSLGTPTSFTITNAGTATGFVINDTAAGTTGTPLQIQSGGTPSLTVSELGAISLTGGSTAALTTLTGGSNLKIQPSINNTASQTGGTLSPLGGDEGGATSIGGGVTIDAGSGTTGGTVTIAGTNASTFSIGRSGLLTNNLGSLTSALS